MKRRMAIRVFEYACRYFRSSAGTKDEGVSDKLIADMLISLRKEISLEEIVNVFFRSRIDPFNPAS